MALPINIDELLHGNTVEWDRIELKTAWNPEDIIHSLCAFANDINNWDGGYIVIGVDEENGKAKLPPVGLRPEQIDSIQKKLIELSHKISPAYIPLSQPYEKDGKLVLIIWAPAGDNRPYKAPVSLSDKKSEKAWYIRRKSVTSRVKDGSGEERRLIELTARVPFDDRVNQLASLNDISLQLIQGYLKEIMSGLYPEISKMAFTDLCKQMRIAKGPDEHLRPTNIGLLLFNEQPDNFFSGAKVELVIHKENTGKDITEKIFTGPIQNQVRNALSFIKTNIIEEQVLKASNKPEAIRFYNYPFEALEEVLVNAIYHKSYERENSVEVQIFPDRIEILNFPGPLPPINNEMLQKERVIARDYRNRRLGDFLKELKLTEGRGTGFPLIRHSLEENGSPPPIFETDDDRNYFLCIIKKHPLSLQNEHKRAKEGAIDKKLSIKSIYDIDKYLRSFNDQRWAKDKDEVLAALENKVKQILSFCTKPKTREEIFKYIGLFNNSKNFNRHLKTLVDLDWLHLTIPDKPTSKNQKYITSKIARRLVSPQSTGLKRIPVSSSNIASVGYNTESKILEIEFHHGAIYQYFEVPMEVYEELVRAGSIGSYFFHNIKGNYEYQKI